MPSSDAATAIERSASTPSSSSASVMSAVHAAVGQRDPLALVAQVVQPGDARRQRPHVAVAEVGRDGLELEHRGVHWGHAT
jgi:hypothetical protein